LDKSSQTLNEKDWALGMGTALTKEDLEGGNNECINVSQKIHCLQRLQ
jgi:hypothetical protein